MNCYSVTIESGCMSYTLYHKAKTAKEAQTKAKNYFNFLYPDCKDVKIVDCFINNNEPVFGYH